MTQPQSLGSSTRYIQHWKELNMKPFVNGSKASCATSFPDRKSSVWYFVKTSWLLCSQSNLSKDIYLLNYQSKVISISWRYCAQASLSWLPAAQNQIGVMMQAYLHVTSVPMQWSWLIAVDHAITTYRYNLPKSLHWLQQIPQPFRSSCKSALAIIYYLCTSLVFHDTRFYQIIWQIFTQGRAK